MLTIFYLLGHNSDLFDEVFTNMPAETGRKNKDELMMLYHDFFNKLQTDSIPSFMEMCIAIYNHSEYFKKMFAFSGWDLYGNMSVTLRQQGTNMLINMFFGVVFNAASALASTVM